jgi:uncharacterized protein
MDDDLHRPLGRDEKRASWLERVGPRRVALAIVAVAGTAVAGLFVLAPRGPLDATLGGRSYAVAKIEPFSPPPPPPAASAGDAATTRDAPPASSVKVRSAEDHAATEVEYQNGVRVVRAGGGGGPNPLIIEVEPRSAARLLPAPDKRLVEKSRFGPLPRIGADGSRPMDVYARPFGPSQRLKAGAPRIALVVGGLSLDPRSTEAAIAELPENVTLAFAPYGANVAADAARARARGHEILLQAPMEPFDYPRNDPGPHTLRVEGGDLKEDLHWLMGRFAGYVGLMSFLGSRFTANEEALAPALEEIARRGLFIVDDGGSPQSLIPPAAAKLSVPAARVDIVLDQRRSPQSLEAALGALEAQARRTGSAIGFANAQGPTIARLARFAREVENRGLVVAPISAVVEKSAGAATAAEAPR